MAPTVNTVLPEVCFIGPYCVVGTGVTIGERVVLDSYTSVDPGVIIGDDTIVIYRASIGGGAKIGKNCVIGGFIPENTVIGDRSRILGTLTHLHSDASMDWDHHEDSEDSPVVESDVFVGLGALVVGGVKLGRKSYICAGAVVNSDVPEKHIVSRGGKVIHYREWNGKLRHSPFFLG
ncbi:hypothetical protein TH47_17970 [Thalassospira sp. MCCC 1A02803]|nr:hypothetical protein AUQ41_09730 [Thalassospira sp. MCCC 1A02898]ONH86107.1 hypothetical protein TH47_17970 [Thalassospira sp. MCCC 1A02803]